MAISICFIFLLIDGATNQIESVAIKEGDSVTLHTDTVIQSKDVIEWRFGAQLDLIAKLNREANTVSVFRGSDGRFGYGLRLNNQSGDLTIIDVTTEHTGDYHLDITRDSTTTKTFSVIVSGDADEVKSVSVMLGDSLTLHPDVTDIRNYDVIRWTLHQGSALLAEIDRKTGLATHDGRFRDKLGLDGQTGSLTIKNIRTDLSGSYAVNITSGGRHTIQQSCTVTVSGEVKPVSVMEGESVSLNTNVSDIQKYDVIEWTSGPQETHIAKISQDENEMSVFDDVLDGRYRNRLQLNVQTGSLTITMSKTEDTGLYGLKISSRRRSINRRFIVTVSYADSGVVAGICIVLVVIAAVCIVVVWYYHQRFPKARAQQVNEGDQVILHADVTVRPGDYVMEWRFGPQSILIAEMGSANHTTHEDALGGRFRGRLTLRPTGSLTINDTRTTDCGLYQLIISSNRKTSYKRFSLTVTSTLQNILVHAGESLILETNTEIQNEKMEWMFGDQDTVIAQIDPALNISSTYDEDTLQLNPDTGDLTINNIRQEHSGVYKLKIFNGEITSYRRFKVSLNDSNTERAPLMNGHNALNVV